jgi:GntR family transcriptional regulator, phosphonate transport system regulatory protein
MSASLAYEDSSSGGTTIEARVRTQGIAVYKSVADALAQEISSGILPPGSRLPPEPELSARFSVNRHTLRRAMSVLSDLGLVNVEHGRGTFVTHGTMNYPVRKEMSFTETISRSSLHPEALFLKSSLVPAKSQLAIDLEVDDETPCVMIEMLRSASGMPISLTSHFFVQSRFPDLAALVESNNSLSASLRQSGVDGYFRKATRISTRISTPEETKLLRQAPSKPVLVAETLNIDGHGHPIEHSVIRSASDRVQYIMET